MVFFVDTAGRTHFCGCAPAMDINYRDLELRLLVADGYTFKVNADGSVGDGDLSWPSLQAFLDSRPLQDRVDERAKRIATVRRALLAAANLSREESRDMTTKEVADDVLNKLMEGEFDAE